MRKTKVVNFKKDQYDIFIGRPSKWGNPFKIRKDGTRDEVIQKYRDWLLNSDKPIGKYDPKYVRENLRLLRGQVLGCWCKPKPCHGDVLVELIEKEKKRHDM